jgi:uncharacterized protein YjiS (DUF1127 family)
MSTLFKSPPSAFTQHEDLEDLRLTEGSAFPVAADAVRQKLAQDCGPNVLRDDHIVLVKLDGLLALYAAFQKWRHHKKTVRALAELDEWQLRDIGLTRDQTHYHALAELGDAQSQHVNNNVLGGRK